MNVTPLRHLSIRVPWHDNGWNGSVCQNPTGNSSCLALNNIGRLRNDSLETEFTGHSIEALNENDRPPCIVERGAFMSAFSFSETKSHPYSSSSKGTHGHLDPTPLFHPPYSAATIPYYWMLKDNAAEVAARFSIDYEESIEPAMPEWAKTWVQHGKNQRALLDAFFDHVRPERSICFFYAKQVPFVEDPRRILVGVGRITNISPSLKYRTSRDGAFDSYVWDRVIEHSIRPDFQDGFLLPYHAAMKLAESDSQFNPAELAVMVPPENLQEFSYVSEHVSDDTAIHLLREALHSINIAKYRLEGPWNCIERWIDKEISNLWKTRGNFPGLGAMLSAFGVRLGNFIGWHIRTRLDQSADFMPVLDAMWKDPHSLLPSQLADCLEPTLALAWAKMKAERRDLFALLCRFELTEDQAERAFNSHVDILANPYALPSVSLDWEVPITCQVIDNGLFPRGAAIPIEGSVVGTALTGPLDARRVSAYLLDALEKTAQGGSTVLAQSQVVDRLKALTCQPHLAINRDILNALEDDLRGQLEIVPCESDECAYQLNRLAGTRTIISSMVMARVGRKSKRSEGCPDFRSSLSKLLQSVDVAADSKEFILNERVAAVEELFKSRFSVLAGSAGSGKTTLLALLSNTSQIQSGGILALAPTGKARIRLQQLLVANEASTVAQFLLRYDRYDADTGKYTLSEKPGYVGAQTVIVDEASMLTEEMLAAIIDATKTAKRIILAGDAAQLPPIGAGRPFFDILQRLGKPTWPEGHPRVVQGYAELTVVLRQLGDGRPDLLLANTFSGRSTAADDFDSILSNIASSTTVQYKQWKTEADLHSMVRTAIAEELGLKNEADLAGFDDSLGAVTGGFFNKDSTKSDGWQILMPNRSGPVGSISVNRSIHLHYREQKLRFAMLPPYARKTPKPIGPENIVYGDKVISNRNKARKPYGDGIGYVANGEIGIVTGPFKTKTGRLAGQLLNVTFASQPGASYTFYESEFSDKVNFPPLELGYALTIHKAQGSQFDLVILVLPEPCALVSREILYTALTRQLRRVVILHQGAPSNLIRYTSDRYSDLAKRVTNIFSVPRIRIVDGVPFDDHLIHISRRGEYMRSKSEVIIADNLLSHGVDYAYELPLVIGNERKLPDFTIEQAATGNTYYWEHCGMLNNETYRRRWLEKLEWYKARRILPLLEGGGANGTLVVTEDGPDGSISSKAINEIIVTELL